MSTTGRSCILIGSSSDESDDGMPSPSPFTEEGRKEWNREQAERKQSMEGIAIQRSNSNTKEPAAKKPRIDLTSARALNMDCKANQILPELQKENKAENSSGMQHTWKEFAPNQNNPNDLQQSIESSTTQKFSQINEGSQAKPQASPPEFISMEENTKAPPKAPAQDNTTTTLSASSEATTKKNPPASVVELQQDPPVTRKKSPVSRVDPPVTRKRSPVTTTTTASQTKEQEPVTRKRSSNRLASTERKLSPSDQKEKAPQDPPVRSTRKKSPTNQKEAASTQDIDSTDEVVTKYVTLPPLPQNLKRISKISRDQLQELETALQLDDEGWRQDWMGNLAFLQKEVPNPTTVPKPGAATLPFWEWALGTTVGTTCRKLLLHLFMYVYHMEGTPERAKQILADAVQNHKDNPAMMATAVHRLSYDPVVLRQDGWTTAKAATPQGASGGAYHIGALLIWQKYEAVVIAYDHDHEIGDLWKCMWLEEYETFDLEAEELQQAMKKYQKKKQQQQGSTGRQTSTGSLAGTSTSSRFAVTSNYTVDGIEYGIVLASSYHPHARMGVLWPARVMHVSEIRTNPLQTKRSSSKNKVHVVFLAPYWNGRSVSGSGGRRVVETYGNNPSQAKNMFSSGDLLEVDTVEVSEDTIHKYPYDGEDLNIDQLRAAFKFSGLPKPAFSRFLDSHRLAMALKTFARHHIKKQVRTAQEDTKAMANLADTHTMAIMSPMFPSAVLHLPFDYILAHLPPPAPEQSYAVEHGEETLEPVVQLGSILDVMKPPNCWGQVQTNGAMNQLVSSPSKSFGRPEQANSPAIMSPQPTVSNGDSHVGESAWTLNNFVSDFLRRDIVEQPNEDSPFSRLGNDLKRLVAQIQRDASGSRELDSTQRREKLKSLLAFCLMVKNHGEDIICSDLNCAVPYGHKIRSEWRKACERIYKRAVLSFSTSDFGDGVTFIVTDSKCNEHVTVSGCVERPVRLPAALKGAKMAGAGSSPKIQIVFPVDERFTDIAEKKVLLKAHKASYLKRMKTRCAGLGPDAKGVPLTDDSDGQGGEDTMGSRGTYTAAVAGVAAALQAVDNIVGGRCTNAFCATRPPGHHAGRDLHPMKAVSNGFCVLNPVACAALYATTPQSEGGQGLRRVCVIDFDVHHGNGTQDILCSTYDPRFLYVSLHAGGAHINGYDNEDDGSSFTPGSTQKNGIFPGRCGDTCPHDGVLNIPLGARVTAQDVGTVLVTRVSPAVEAFAPDLIILSAGFDAHKNDPLGMGGLCAQDFGSITDVACSMAFRSCSGRVLSILEGGYGIPCCRPQHDLFLPPATSQMSDVYITSQESMSVGPHAMQQQLKVFDLDGELPDTMEDQLPAGLRRKVDKCHAEGFVDCVKEHISSLSKHNTRKT